MPKPFLPRIHLFEFLDQPWLPRILRRYLADYLEFVQHRFGFDELMAETLLEEIQANKAEKIVDLGSGSGGPVLGLVRHLSRTGEDVEVLLTDLHPDQPTLDRFAEHSRVHYHSEPVDATAVPAELVGLRTMINSLHHLKPEQVRALLADAAEKRQPLVTFDVVERKLSSVFVLFFIPLFVLLMTPLIRPFRLSRLFLTYPLPLVTLLTTWDGFVSQLRAYSPDELSALATEPEGTYAYTFETGLITKGPMRVTYLIGRPTQIVPT